MTLVSMQRTSNLFYRSLQDLNVSNIVFIDLPRPVCTDLPSESKTIVVEGSGGMLNDFCAVDALFGTCNVRRSRFLSPAVLINDGVLEAGTDFDVNFNECPFISLLG